MVKDIYVLLPEKWAWNSVACDSAKDVNLLENVDIPIEYEYDQMSF